EWEACQEPGPMLSHLAGRASERKLRLFTVACCRRVWPWLADERSRWAVEIAERFADRWATDAERRRAAGAREAAPLACAVSHRTDDAAASFTVVSGLSWRRGRPGGDYAALAAKNVTRRHRDERVPQSALVRCVFGNPFHPVAFD